MSLGSEIPKPVSVVLYDSNNLAHSPAFLTPLQLLTSPPYTPSHIPNHIYVYGRHC